MKQFGFSDRADECGALKTAGALVAVVLCLLAAPASAAELLVIQDFENPGWESQFTGQSSWGDNVARTTHAAQNGSFSLRWNQDDHRTDPITGLVGIGNALLDWRGGIDLVASTPHELYFSMWFRHDDYTSEAGFSNSARKLFYIVDDQYNVGGMYVKFQGGTVGLQISYANGGYPDQWARDNWGYSGMAMSAPGVLPSTSGTWRKVEMYWNYDAHYLMMWLDGVLLMPQDPDYKLNYPADAAAGRVLWDPTLTLHARGMQMMYYDSDRDLVNGTDGSGFYAGVQIDDLEFWNGLPSSPDMPEVPGKPGVDPPR